MDYFPHDTDAANDEKIEALQALFGNDGYAFYFKMLERIYRQPNAELPISDPQTRIVLAQKCLVSLERFEQMVQAAIKWGCFDGEAYDLGVLTSRGVKKRFQEVDTQRKRWRTPVSVGVSQELSAGFRGGLSTEITTEVTDTKTPQSKAKQTKANEIEEQSPSKLDIPLEVKGVALYDTLPEPPTGCIRNSDSWGKLLRRIEQYKSVTAQHHRKGATLKENEKLALVGARDACCKAITEKWSGCTLVGKCTQYINDKVSQVIAKNSDQPLDNPIFYFAAMFKNLADDDETAERIGRAVKEMRNGRVLR